MTENSLLIFCSENAKLAYLCQFAQVQMCLIIWCAYEKPRHNSKLLAQLLCSLLFTHHFRWSRIYWYLLNQKAMCKICKGKLDNDSRFSLSVFL